MILSAHLNDASACCAAREEDEDELYGSPPREDSFERQSADGNSMAVVVKEESEDQLAGLVDYTLCVLSKLPCWTRRPVSCTAQAGCHAVVTLTLQWNFGSAALMCSQEHLSCLTLRV